MPNKAELLAGLIDANGDVLATNLDNVSVAFADVTSKPTTLAGYGITDAASDTELTNAVANSANWDTAYGWGNHASAGYATTTYVDNEVAGIVASAPAALDTLNELAAALGDDANFSTTVTNSIATKAPLANPTFTTGIDVTGTVTADGLTVDGTTTVGNNQSLEILDGVGDISLRVSNLSSSGNSGVISVDPDNTGASSALQIHIDGTNKRVANFAAGGDISFYEDTGTTPKLFWDASEERLGIGTNGTPQNSNADLFIKSSVPFIELEDTEGGYGRCYLSAGNLILDADHGNTQASSYIALRVDDGERVRIEADGDLHADGDVIAYSTTISDARLKDNIVGINNALAKVGQLNGYTFEYKADGKVSAGVIAQEVEQVLPEAVSEKKLPLKTDDDQDYKVVNYDALHGLLIEAIKELSARVEALEAK